MDEETFWRSTKQEGECLIWTRGKGGGYGYCLYDGVSGPAHRASFRIQMGRWPRGVLHHLCGNRACVRLAHLQEVTKKEHAHIHWGSKTHCPKGHPYSGDNLIVYRGRRNCRQCNNDRGREYMRKKRARLREQRGPIEPASHCKNGHPWDETNTRWYQPSDRSTPRRFCRSCERERSRRRAGEVVEHLGSSSCGERTHSARPGCGGCVGPSDAPPFTTHRREVTSEAR